MRRLPEFKFWWMSLKSIGTAFVMTFLPMCSTFPCFGDSRDVLNHALLHDDEAAGEAPDQAQVRAVHDREAEIRGRGAGGGSGSVHHE